MQKTYIIPQVKTVDGEQIEVPVKQVKCFIDKKGEFQKLVNGNGQFYPMVQVKIGVEGDKKDAFYAVALLDWYKTGQGYWKIKRTEMVRELPETPEGHLDTCEINKRGGEHKFPIVPKEIFRHTEETAHNMHAHLTKRWGEERASEIIQLILAEWAEVSAKVA